MSLLLDALNKADKERKRNAATPGIDSKHGEYLEHPPHRVSLLTATLFLFIVGALLLGGYFWFYKHNPNTTQLTTAAENNVAMPQQLSNNELTPIKITTTVTPTTSTAATTVTTSHQTTQLPQTHIADLYQQQNNNPKPINNSINDVKNVNASATTENIKNPTSENNNAPTSINQFANLPELHDLPSTVLNKIPSLNYSEHHYNSNGGSVMINGAIKHANDQIANGLVIDKILEDGMVLHYDNYSFKMRALNSWVNM